MPVDAENLVAERDDCFYFEACVDAAGATPAAGFAVGKLLLNAGSKRANEKKCLIHQLGATPTQVAQLVKLREANEVGPQAADQLFGFMCDSDDTVWPWRKRTDFFKCAMTPRLTRGWRRPFLRNRKPPPTWPLARTPPLAA